MFIVLMTYICELDKVDTLLSEHVAYLEKQYAKGNFIASGRKVPRTGGVILSKLRTRKALKDVLNQDPFKINNLAEYEIVEFIPSMTSDTFINLKEENS